MQYGDNGEILAVYGPNKGKPIKNQPQNNR
jgi:hypothetical protein